ncbi:MAG: hypothetical protein WKF33_08315 [Thermoleophilaceae bacterium]
MSAPGAQLAEPIKVGRYRRRIQLVYPDVKDADMSWAEALADLEEAIRDPIARYLRIEKFHRAGRKPAPWIKTDKPWDDPDVTGKLPALDSLTHDKAYFRAVEQARTAGCSTTPGAQRRLRTVLGGPGTRPVLEAHDAKGLPCTRRRRPRFGGPRLQGARQPSAASRVHRPPDCFQSWRVGARYGHRRSTPARAPLESTRSSAHPATASP